jgi:hypothetical protein
MAAPELVAFIIGVLLRFAVPIVLTAVAVWFFRKLDRRWQTEATDRVRLQMAMLAAQRTPCWEQKQCVAEKRATCPAYLEKSVPCWQIFRAKDGNLKPACLSCGVFRGAPVPEHV